MTTNNTFSNQKREENNTFCNLTEQWKKGELDRNKLYYYETPFMTTDSASGFWLSNTLDKEKDKVEILSEVPSYEEWQQMKAFCEGFNTLEVSEENQKLKELLKECRYKIIADLDKARLCKSSVDIEDFEYMLNRIDEVLNVPNE